ncbi:MAG: hypothetical protein NW216_13270 [Hyphomicrobium sp.]|nr:hypothetical protein [Hyphomicrobium sp.]
MRRPLMIRDDERTDALEKYAIEDRAIIAAARRRSEVFVQTLFGSLSLTFAALAIVAHHEPRWLAIHDLDSEMIASALLILSSSYVLLMMVWERIWRGREPV